MQIDKEVLAIIDEDADASTLNDLKAEAYEIIENAKQLVISKYEALVNDLKNADAREMYNIITKAINSKYAIEAISSFAGGVTKYSDYIDKLIAEQPERKAELEANLKDELKENIRGILKNMERI